MTKGTYDERQSAWSTEGKEKNKRKGGEIIICMESFSCFGLFAWNRARNQGEQRGAA
jgi:hypothetical protein